MTKRKETETATRLREMLQRTLNKLELAESKMLRAIHKFEDLRAAKKRYTVRLAKELVKE